MAPARASSSRSARRARPHLAGIALALVATLASLGLAEFLLARFRPVSFRAPPGEVRGWRALLHRASAVPGLDYELAPNREVERWGGVVRTNSRGMRGPEPAPPRTLDLRRIAVIGDSVTFGYGVDADETYSAVLARLLARDRRDGEPRTEVLNFGVGGYSAQDEVRVVRHKAMAFEPSLLIIGYSLNDAESRPFHPLQSSFAEARWWQRFHLLRLVAQFDHQRRIQRYGDGRYIRSLYAEGNGLWPGVVEGFAQIADLGRQAGAPVLLIIFPNLAHWSVDAYPFADLHDKVAEAARSNGFAVLDVARTFDAIEVERLRAPGDRLHPSRLGHRLVAEAIHARLRATPELLLTVGRAAEASQESFR